MHRVKTHKPKHAIITKGLNREIESCILSPVDDNRELTV